ncbi:MAG: Na+/H+ antiporter NhaA [Microbacterium sp.]|uniref:Na+/H+ antiporter NhaA n=1 Tax=Microbacterium sp. TaxID=51671 RepID=UPI0039E5E8D4
MPFPPGGAETTRLGALLRTEAVGGALLVAMAVVAIVWANSPWAEGYFWLRDLEVGYEPWRLRLSLGAWAADGLLAVFFFLVGLELKREFVAGDLRNPRIAIVPVAAAAGGVAVPALCYLGATWHEPSLLRGWAIPTATDIAFAVAVLAIIGSHVPSALRVFLLTLAVVDDLIAIGIIAVFYTEQIELVPLGLGLLAVCVYGALAQRRRQCFHVRPAAAWLILLPVGIVAWAFVHASGIHATVAGVLLGFTIPVRRRDGGPVGEPCLAEVFEHRFRPLSAGVAVPLFALFSAGVALGGGEGMAAALADPVAIGVVLGLVVGKPVGIVATTWAVTRLRSIRLDPALRWADLVGVGLLGGIGFTVSLLVTELSFASADPRHGRAKVAILFGSVLAAVLAAILLAARNRRYRRIADVGRADVGRAGGGAEARGDGAEGVYGGR